MPHSHPVSRTASYALLGNSGTHRYPLIPMVLKLMFPDWNGRNGGIWKCAHCPKDLAQPRCRPHMVPFLIYDVWYIWMGGMNIMNTQGKGVWKKAFEREWLQIFATFGWTDESFLSSGCLRTGRYIYFLAKSAVDFIICFGKCHVFVEPTKQIQKIERALFFLDKIKAA